MQKYVAEFFGTFWLVLGGFGTLAARKIERHHEPTKLHRKVENWHLQSAISS
jgi:glycerol uptake facilitator-like aquaporin